MIKLKPLIRGGFTEKIYVDPYTHDEVMVDVNNLGDVIDAYVYNDSPLIKDDEYDWKWVVGKNPLFYRIGERVRDKNVFVNWIVGLGYEESENQI